MIYKGDSYHYSSPDFTTGLQIIEASNGTGKTTFSAFICYGLGMYVKQFDFRDNKENHSEIYNDSNNYVLLIIKINNQRFELTRYFNSNNNNIIFVKGHEVNESYPIYRNALTNDNDLIFSDWLLDQLGIDVCEIYQGTKKFKINFSDLFRLIHYDQDTNPTKIYKEHRVDNNFVSDSTAIRKVIFELLVGNQFSEYYSLIGEYNRIEKEKNTHKATLENYIDMLNEMGYRLGVLSKEELLQDKKNYELQLQKLKLYKNELKSKSYSNSQYENHIKALRGNIFEIETKYHALKSNKRNTSIELKNLLRLKEDLILEVTQIKKIILAHEELNLFSPNTCPICLNEVKRKEHHCICGNPIDENQYEKFFYDSNEYLDILKSKQKSVDTIENAILSCREELEEIETSIAKLDISKEKAKNQLNEIEHSLHLISNDSELNDLNEKILNVNQNIKDADQKLKVFDKYYELEQNFNKSKSKLDNIYRKLTNLEKKAQLQMKEQISLFNSTYTVYMINADKNVRSAKIDEDYMPVINDGEYRQASANVPKRFLYFLTLLHMSLENQNVPFPRFLLIDTPENLGIDEENLDLCISLIDEINSLKSDFQIILTTGIKKYPAKFKTNVRETLTDENKLLKKIN